MSKISEHRRHMPDVLIERLIAESLKIRVRHQYKDLEIFSPVTGDIFSVKIPKRELQFLLSRFPGLRTEE